MKKNLLKAALFFVVTVLSYASFGQNYSFEDFVGTWHGNITSSNFGGYNDPMTMVIHSDGFYTETSGHLMPSLYPDTQQCEYQDSTNRMHWWYVSTVYGGQYFYDHHFYEVVYFQNDTLIMHYNYWDDPQPNPEAGTIFLVKELATNLDGLNNASFSIYPNPASEYVFIEGVEDIRTIRIFNLAGRAIKSIDVAGLTRKIDVSDLDKGVYLMSIETSNGLISKRLIVQ